ncbi:MAG: YcxB family protein [Niabella sp.]|nr:YcxB family protein [Niabella sp.]
MTIHFGYDKKQVIQALRYHFISKKEIRIMIILVNVFAILSLVLYALHKITPVAFLINSFLWLLLMISLWFILPGVVYRRAETFRHAFTMYFSDVDFTLEHTKGKRSWPYTALHSHRESPHFFHLYFDERSFLLVPKSAFADSDEVSKFRNLLMDKIRRK